MSKTLIWLGILSRLAVHVSFIHSDQVLSRLLGLGVLGSDGAGCMFYVSRLSCFWYVPVGWFPALQRQPLVHSCSALSKS